MRRMIKEQKAVEIDQAELYKMKNIIVKKTHLLGKTED